MVLALLRWPKPAGVVLVLLAFVAVKVFAVLGTGRVPRMSEVQVSPGVLLFSVVLSLIMTIFRR